VREAACDTRSRHDVNRVKKTIWAGFARDNVKARLAHDRETHAHQ
jgi:hypothetical protein